MTPTVAVHVSSTSPLPKKMMLLAIILLSTLSQSQITAARPERDDAWERIDVNNNRRTAKVRTLQYGNTSGQGHPYEMYSSHRLTRIPPHQNEREERSDEAPPSQLGLRQDWGSHYDNNDGDDASDVYFEGNRYPDPTQQPPTSHPSGVPTPHPTLSPTIISYNPSLYKPIRIEMDSRQLQSHENDYLVYYITTVAAPKAAKFWTDHLSIIPVEGSIVVTNDDCPVAWSDDDDSEYHVFESSDLILYLLVDEAPCRREDPPIAFSNDCLMDQFDR